MSAQRSLVDRWIADDTEESIVGADWHQDAISSVNNGMREVARTRGWPWHVGNQLTLVAAHPDGSVWRPIPDIMVHPQAGPRAREEIDATREGLPVLIIEVASRTTYRSDIQVAPPTRRQQDAKGYEYLAWPLPEYLVFDPVGSYLRGQVRAWRTVEGHVQPWQPDASGRYHSTMLGVSFRPEGFFLRVFDPEGVPVPFDHEQGSLRMQALQQAARERAERERAEQEIAALRARIERLRGKENG